MHLYGCIVFGTSGRKFSVPRFEKQALSDAAAKVEGVGETLSAYILGKM